MLLPIQDYLPYSIPFGNQFLRRPDLTAKVRLEIAIDAYLAMKNNNWGTITNLSNEFMISRTFVYMLKSDLEEISPIIFGTTIPNNARLGRELALQYMLSLRLEGQCSNGSMSTIMKRFDLKPAATGSISQYLSYFGSLLPNTLTLEQNEIQFIIFLSDEIFSKRTPILITVDPISSAILRVELTNIRKAEVWKNHWECIEKNGYYVAYLVCDEGEALKKAHKETFSNIFKQTDTYHAIAHKLGQWGQQT